MNASNQLRQAEENVRKTRAEAESLKEAAQQAAQWLETAKAAKEKARKAAKLAKKEAKHAKKAAAKALKSHQVALRSLEALKTPAKAPVVKGRRNASDSGKAKASVQLNGQPAAKPKITTSSKKAAVLRKPAARRAPKVQAKEEASPTVTPAAGPLSPPALELSTTDGMAWAQAEPLSPPPTFPEAPPAHNVWMPPPHLDEPAN